MKWFKIYGEKWFMGTTRWELPVEQRAVWVDLLARASMNDPPGQIDYYSLEQLSQQFNIDLDLLEASLKKCVEVEKIKFFPKKKKIFIINWNKYQSEYERQRVYRQQPRTKSKVTKKNVDLCNQVTHRKEGEEEEDNKKKKGEEDGDPF